MKRKFLLCLAIGFLLVGMAGVATAATIDAIVNGDFESGLTGWSINNPDNYDFGIATIDIDGVGSLSSSDAFFTQTGGGYGSSPVDLSQAVSLIGGVEYTLSANIASYDSYSLTNASGGVITATVGGATIDSFDFGSIAAETWEYGILSGTFTPAASGLFNINFYRPYLSTNYTPFQYIDNISLTYESTQDQQVPEPSSVFLLGFGLLGFAGAARKKMKK